MINKAIYDAIDMAVKQVDSSWNFIKQVEFITEKTEQICSLLCIPFDKNDAEIQIAIKESVVIKEDKPTVFEAKGYVPWLNDARSSITWNFYNRYEKYLLKKKKWNWGTITSMNEITDVILDHMKNPKTTNCFAVKGLVMGDIQSGKTANYTALINKALDAGYKFIIVLAGMTKDLRSQTQKRLDKEVLGYETRVDNKKGTAIGVGIDCKEVLYINALTHSGDLGDLKKSITESISTSLHQDMKPIIAVLKKNSSVLKALNENFLAAEYHTRTNGKLDVPLLVIDDEVDQASVNTKDTEVLEEASSINKLIRECLSKFNRYSYVGYTATPFANVFINPYGFKTEEEKDIFPEDFIICLPRPKDYCGVKEYFGINTITEYDDDAITLDLFKKVDDYSDLFAPGTYKIKVDTPVVQLNESLKDAFMHFIISSAVKYSRNIIEHNSMLIHIARFKNPATSLRELVKNHISEMMRQYKYGSQKDKNLYKTYWEEHIKPVSLNRLGEEFSDKWCNIEKHILKVFELTLNGVKIVNGDSADVCDYDSSNVGQHVIIGGDKLSRGLTLEGLIVSYYYRKTRTYDALLQMGRWFGYRNGWIDLCRIYSNIEYVNDFINAGIATENFKKDIHEMNSQKLTPNEFGLKVQYSPKLAPTSHSKMRKALKQRISFSSSVQQLLSFQKNYVEHNRSITNKFIDELGVGEIRKSGNIVFKNISADIVLKYLKSYKECDELAGFVSIQNWINYISKLNENGELINWTVVLHSNSKPDKEMEDTIGSYTITKIKRTDRNLNVNENNESLYVKVLTDPLDFREFYDPNSLNYKTVKEYKPTDPEILKTFTSEYGVLSIYVADIHKKILVDTIVDEFGKTKHKYGAGDILPFGEGVIGLGAWFSTTKNYQDSAVEYYVNSVYLKKMEETDDDSEELL